MKKQERILTWFDKADHDLSSAKIIFLHLPENVDIVGFHCQQAIEKFLKGYLIFLDIDYKPVHDLLYLLNLIIIEDKDFDSYFDRIALLDSYAVKIRYPESIIIPSDEEIKEAVSLADEIRNLVLKKMGISS